MSWINDMFGSIANGFGLTRTQADFIPIGPKGKTLDIKGQNATWIGLQNPLMQKYAYDFCYPVASVADKLAEMDTNGKWDIFNIGGKANEKPSTGIKANEVRALFLQPNPFQSWEQFRGQQVMYKRIFGFCPVLPLKAAFTGAVTQMVNLPPWLFTVRTKSRNQQNTLFPTKDELIECYLFTLFGTVAEIKPEDVIILEDSFMQSYQDNKGVLPQSRLVGLDMAVSNICAAMEADNVLLKKKGPLGFISHDAAAVKDSVAGYLPMTPKEKKELQKELSGYGLTLSQYQYIISRQAVRWNPMSYDVKQLGTKETLVQCEKAICHRFGYPYILYEETETTYANGDNAAASVYQNNVIPNAEKDFNKYNKFFQLAESKLILKVNYTEVAALQEDKKMAADVGKTNNETWKMDFDNDLITLNEWRVLRGYDEKPDGNVYKSQLTKPKDENTTPENKATSAA